MGFHLPSSIASWYLVIFNSVSWAGWAYILVRASQHLFLETDLEYQSLYGVVGDTLRNVQTLALFEVLHVALGLVRSSLGTTAMQVASRIMVVWGLLYMFPHPEVQQGYGFVTCVYAWSITECIRYSFYALKEFGLEPYLLIWARYTFFFVLYPVGVSGELLVFWNSLPYAKELRKTYYQLLILIMINYAPGFFNMYTYMIKQRKKVIGGGGAKKSGTKTGSNKAMLSPKKAKKL